LYIARVDAPHIVVSIVSHRQGALLEPLMRDLVRLRQPELEVTLTLNEREALPFSPAALGVPVNLVQNTLPKGFGANHNAAFAHRRGAYFCVANPDLRVPANPFPALIAQLADARTGVAAPLVEGPQGTVEDSARRFPTARSLLLKGLHKVARRAPVLDYGVPSAAFDVDWVAGMFMLFRTETFSRLAGFDERYHMYYEDVELCARARLAGLRVVVDPAARVIHAARRASHRRLRHAWWHGRSIARWLRSDTYRRLQA
jgi:N-acetylglucosaminyl-diphospho-decaprenol L-rhamnosyltransferase